jgi:hypothetical protein
LHLVASVRSSLSFAYTRRLLSAVPSLEDAGGGGVRLKWRFDMPSSIGAGTPQGVRC